MVARASPPRPHSPAGLAAQAGFRCKPFASACRGGPGSLVCRHFRSASKLHPGPLPSAPASWQEAGFGFVMFPLQTRPGGHACGHVRPGAGSILPPAPLSEPPWRHGRVASSGASRFRGGGGGASDLTQKVGASPGIHRCFWDPSMRFYCAAALVSFSSCPRTALSRAGTQGHRTGEGPGPASPNVGWGARQAENPRRDSRISAPGTGGPAQGAHGADCVSAGVSRTAAAELSGGTAGRGAGVPAGCQERAVWREAPGGSGLGR